MMKIKFLLVLILSFIVGVTFAGITITPPPGGGGGGGDSWSDPVDSSITFDSDTTHDIGDSTNSLRDLYLQNIKTITGATALNFSTGSTKFVGNLLPNDLFRSIGNSSTNLLNLYVSAIRNGSNIIFDVGQQELRDTSGNVMILWSGNRVDMTSSPGPLQVPTLAADPGTPANGDMWYNTTDNKFRIRANSVTVDLN